MAVSDKRIVYTDPDEVNLCIVCPAIGTSKTIEQIQESDVPDGVTSYIIDKSEVPTDRTFRNAWTYTP